MLFGVYLACALLKLNSPPVNSPICLHPANNKNKVSMSHEKKPLLPVQPR